MTWLYFLDLFPLTSTIRGSFLAPTSLLPVMYALGGFKDLVILSLHQGKCLPHKMSGMGSTHSRLPWIVQGKWNMNNKMAPYSLQNAPIDPNGVKPFISFIFFHPLCFQTCLWWEFIHIEFSQVTMAKIYICLGGECARKIQNAWCKNWSRFQVSHQPMFIPLHSP